MTTPEQERERIAGVYSGMSDGELEKIAKSGDELSDIALQLWSRKSLAEASSLQSPHHRASMSTN
jgi:hypothetical protein